MKSGLILLAAGLLVVSTQAALAYEPAVAEPATTLPSAEQPIASRPGSIDAPGGPGYYPGPGPGYPQDLGYGRNPYFAPPPGYGQPPDYEPPSRYEPRRRSFGFKDFCPLPGFGSSRSSSRRWGPSSRSRGINLERDMDEQNYYLKIHLGDLDPIAVQITPMGNSLRISSAQSFRDERRDDGSYSYSWRSGSLNRRVSLPRDADVANMKRSDSKSMILITLPRLSGGGFDQGYPPRQEYGPSYGTDYGAFYPPAQMPGGAGAMQSPQPGYGYGTPDSSYAPGPDQPYGYGTPQENTGATTAAPVPSQ